ncbi:MAG: hypothetical protein Q4B43_05675 [Bacteroidota bacterium]|nr:hypothetical protein [Bacteroidota bacterium]
MKNTVWLVIIILIQFSCQKKATQNDTELTPSEQIRELEGIKTENKGCRADLGEIWSELYKVCVPILVEGKELAPIGSSANERQIAAYVLMAKDSLKAELFIPDDTQSIILEQVSKGVYQYSNYQYNMGEGILKINDKETFKAK